MSTRDGQSIKEVARANAGAKSRTTDHAVIGSATLLKRPFPPASAEKATEQRNQSRVVSPIPSEQFSTPRPRFRGRVLLALFGLIFALGVLVQFAAPRLKIEHGAFVIPSDSMSAGKEFHPAEIVSRERRMQELSAVLTLAGALGLAVQYRRVSVRRQNA